MAPIRYNSPVSKAKQIWPPLLLLIAIVAAGIYFISRPPAPAPNEIEGLLWPPGNPLPNFTLRTERGDKFDIGNLKGRWSWVFFGYTECPDICPTTLRTMNRIADKMAGDKEAQFIFVSIDPEHDNPEQMQRYLQTTAPKVTGLSGSAGEIAQITRELGIAHTTAANPSASGSIEHTASILLLDPLARRVAIFSPPLDAEALIKRYETIRQFVAANQ